MPEANHVSSFLCCPVLLEEHEIRWWIWSRHEQHHRAWIFALSQLSSSSFCTSFLSCSCRHFFFFFFPSFFFLSQSTRTTHWNESIEPGLGKEEEEEETEKEIQRNSWNQEERMKSWRMGSNDFFNSVLLLLHTRRIRNETQKFTKKSAPGVKRRIIPFFSWTQFSKHLSPPSSLRSKPHSLIRNDSPDTISVSHCYIPSDMDRRIYVFCSQFSKLQLCSHLSPNLVSC